MKFKMTLTHNEDYEGFLHHTYNYWGPTPLQNVALDDRVMI